MGAQIEVTDTGDELEIHKFDDRQVARDYIMVSRRYKFDRHEEWAFSFGIDFFQGPERNQRASLRKKAGYWSAAFWVRK